MDNNKKSVNVNDILATMSNASKVMANLTNEKQKRDNQNKRPNNYKDGDTNTAQSVNIQLGEKESKPTIIREKPETHIHKSYPDDRAMTESECEVEKLRIKLDFEAKRQELEFRREIDEKDRAERMERERRQREERKRNNRNAGIFAGVTVAGIIGLCAYGFYSAARDDRANKGNIPKNMRIEYVPDKIEAEGVVE